MTIQGMHGGDYAGIHIYICIYIYMYIYVDTYIYKHTYRVCMGVIMLE
jgi:hypothetical protein